MVDPAGYLTILDRGVRADPGPTIQGVKGVFDINVKALAGCSEESLSFTLEIVDCADDMLTDPLIAPVFKYVVGDENPEFDYTPYIFESLLFGKTPNPSCG